MHMTYSHCSFSKPSPENPLPAFPYEHFPSLLPPFLYTYINFSQEAESKNFSLFVDRGSVKGMFISKTVEDRRSSELDKVPITWYRVRACEGIELSVNWKSYWYCTSRNEHCWVSDGLAIPTYNTTVLTPAASQQATIGPALAVNSDAMHLKRIRNG